MTTTYDEFPCWFYSTEDGTGRIFNTLEEVPAVGWSTNPQQHLQAVIAPSNDGETSFGGFTLAELTQLVRSNGGRISARDSAFKLYQRAEEAGLIVDGQLAGND